MANFIKNFSTYEISLVSCGTPFFLTLLANLSNIFLLDLFFLIESIILIASGLFCNSFSILSILDFGTDTANITKFSVSPCLISISSSAFMFAVGILAAKTLILSPSLAFIKASSTILESNLSKTAN